ncbi:hypothetical protein BD410DRAFT_488640 [Rickenella mellea]|uniref:Uncharacterized protein n=1 Tax=Rickenella mellea TaxID=50990 RepID=A0A4Y7PU07_9AGAM|nr:hypothetical protein BD410DRAFT_488640 [Rickenella mellea]
MFVQLASVILSLIIDALVFTLTFAKTIRHTIEMRKSGLGNGLGYFILRDGAMYFLAKLLIGVVATTVFIFRCGSFVFSFFTVIAYPFRGLKGPCRQLGSRN